jgi:hypothetical protein
MHGMEWNFKELHGKDRHGMARKCMEMAWIGKAWKWRGNGMAWKGMEMARLEEECKWHGMKRNGNGVAMEWKGMPWKGKACNDKEMHRYGMACICNGMVIA